MYHVHAHGNHDAQRSVKKGLQGQGRTLKTLRTKQDWDQRVVAVGPRKVCSGAAILIDGTMGARRKEERGGVYVSFFFLIHRSHSISFTRAQGIPKYVCVGVCVCVCGGGGNTNSTG
jgi:hypothetical protein